MTRRCAQESVVELIKKDATTTRFYKDKHGETNRILSEDEVQALAHEQELATKKYRRNWLNQIEDETVPPVLPCFDEARQCPGDPKLDDLLLGRKWSDSLLSERAELARTWLSKHICRPTPCGTIRRVKKFLEDYAGLGSSSSSSSGPQAMDVEDAD